MVLARTDKVIGCVRILLRCKSPDVALFGPLAMSDLSP